jgi:hypothetical protein
MIHGSQTPSWWGRSADNQPAPAVVFLIGGCMTQSSYYIAQAERRKALYGSHELKSADIPQRITGQAEFYQPTKPKGAGFQSKSRAVQNLETGEIFDTITEAAEVYGCSDMRIIDRAKRDRGWKYVDAELKPVEPVKKGQGK